MTQGGAVEAGIFWSARWGTPGLRVARPNSDAPGIRSVMVWSMNLTASGTQPATSWAAPGGSGEAEVAG
jgi:hypothetical protein